MLILFAQSAYHWGSSPQKNGIYLHILWTSDSEVYFYVGQSQQTKTRLANHNCAIAEAATFRTIRMRAVFDRYVMRAEYDSEMEEYGRAGQDIKIPPRVVCNLQVSFSPEAQMLYNRVAERHLDKPYKKNPVNHKSYCG
jgi:hypothetical protein